MFLQKDLMQRKENEKLQLWFKANEPVLERKAKESEHRKISAPGVQPSPHGSYRKHKAKGLQKRTIFISAALVALVGRSVDTVEVISLVGSSSSVFNKLTEELLFGEKYHSRRHCHRQLWEEPMGREKS